MKRRGIYQISPKKASEDSQGQSVVETPRSSDTETANNMTSPCSDIGDRKSVSSIAKCSNQIPVKEECNDSNMPRLFRRSSNTYQEQPLVSNYANHYDQYPEDSEVGDSCNHHNASFDRSKDSTDEDQRNESTGERFRENISLYKGLLFSSFSSIFFSLSSVIVKYAKDIHPGELSVLRFIGILIFTLPVLIYSREDPFGPRKVRHFLIFRGFVGATSLFLRFFAFRYLPIADASVIIFSIPVFVSVLARIFLKEPCGIFHVFTVLLTLIGIVLITKLPVILAHEIANYNMDHLYGVLAALGSTIFGASVYVVIRKVKGVHHAVIMFNFGWVAIIETTTLTAAMGKFTFPMCGLEQWLVILLGIFSFFGQTLLTLALKEEHAGPVAIVRAATDIVLAFLWQIWFFGEIPDVYSISGAVLVSSCVVLISIRKWVMSLPEHSSIRKKAYLLTI